MSASFSSAGELTRSPSPTLPLSALALPPPLPSRACTAYADPFGGLRTPALPPEP